MIKDSLNLCGLWRRTNDKGQEYFIGSFLGIKVLVFPNDKKGNEKAPDFRIILAPKEDRPQNHAPQSQSEASGSFDDFPPF